MLKKYYHLIYAAYFRLLTSISIREYRIIGKIILLFYKFRYLIEIISFNPLKGIQLIKIIKFSKEQGQNFDVVNYIYLKYPWTISNMQIKDSISLVEYELIGEPSLFKRDVLVGKDKVIKIYPQNSILFNKELDEINAYLLLESSSFTVKFLPKVYILNSDLNFVILSREQTVENNKSRTDLYKLIEFLPILHEQLKSITGAPMSHRFDSVFYYNYQYQYILSRVDRSINLELYNSLKKLKMIIGGSLGFLRSIEKISKCISHSDLNSENYGYSEIENFVIIDWESLSINPVNFDLSFILGKEDINFSNEMIFNLLNLDLCEINNQFLFWNLIYFYLKNNQQHYDNNGLLKFVLNIIDKIENQLVEQL